MKKPTCHADAELVSMPLSDVADKVGSMLEAIIGGDPVLLAPRRITPQGENVGDTQLKCSLI